jgi:hypothetical protein
MPKSISNSDIDAFSPSPLYSRFNSRLESNYNELVNPLLSSQAPGRDQSTYNSVNVEFSNCFSRDQSIERKEARFTIKMLSKEI